ncbi:UDP-N-acetylmuramate--L-alanine ligase [Candidatus Uhrbacteria bacterium]|nr:UDP-N-acetylmuramate--L-alanine ligase [Candidatus Uhrbacteria bacterium]
MNIRDIKAAHFVGIGGINMAAVAKLLIANGVKVSGSDMAENEQTRILGERGAVVSIGHAAENVPVGVEILIHTSAAPESNPEREEARKRGVPEMTNFRFLAEWYKDAKTIVVTGTHGKSTTTAMLGLALEKSNLEPTVIVGSKVPGFADGNLRIGKSEFFLIEGDEYARHFLEFEPYGAIINNIELDHTDIYPTLADYVDAFRMMLSKIKDGGVVVANVGDKNVADLLEKSAEGLAAKHARVIKYNGETEGDWRFSLKQEQGVTEFKLVKDEVSYSFNLRVPGMHNALNAAGAALMALQLGAPYHAVAGSLEAFKGIWRRFEFLGELDGARVYSDYGHHPTAVSSTLAAAKEIFPAARLVLCFQPHHRNRTRNLFADFVPSFDKADVLVLCEIYDVKGRDAAEDAEVSSKQLVAAVMLLDAEKGRQRIVEFAPDPAAAMERIKSLLQPGDTVIIMGAGDIDDEARKLF